VSGRPRGPVCELCDWVHDEIRRPGWAVRRLWVRQGLHQTMRAVVTDRGHFTVGLLPVGRGERITIQAERDPASFREHGPFIEGADHRGWKLCERCHQFAPDTKESLRARLEWRCDACEGRETDTLLVPRGHGLEAALPIMTVAMHYEGCTQKPIDRREDDTLPPVRLLRVLRRLSGEERGYKLMDITPKRFD